MKSVLCSLAAVATLVLTNTAVLAQEENPAAIESSAVPVEQESATQPEATSEAEAVTEASDAPAEVPSTAGPEQELAEKAKELAIETQAKVEEVAKKVDQNETAQKAAEGVLGPIYKLAEALNFSAFHWLAFSLMAAGVVSFALQLVLGKLMVLFKGSINLREIISDAIGLLISTLGLVLTTQAAAENSTFTHSPAAVLSAAAFGVVVGFTLYRWGQAQEVNAVVGQRAGHGSRK